MHGTDQSCTVSLAAAVAGWTGRDGGRWIDIVFSWVTSSIVVRTERPMGCCGGTTQWSLVGSIVQVR